MRIRALKSHWDRLGKSDPLWAVLTQDEFKGGKNLEKFLESGVSDIDAMMALLQDMDLGEPGSRNRALDFGCGVGRGTLALKRYYAAVVGIDIAPLMIERARHLSQDTSGVEYIINDQPDLRLLDDESFDLVYSNIVMQHMEPVLSTRYLRELVRVTRQGGALVFQLPSKTPAPTSHSRLALAKRLLRDHGPDGVVCAYDAISRMIRNGNRPIMEMYAVERSKVEALLQAAGARVVATLEDPSVGPEWESFRYVVTK